MFFHVHGMFAWTRGFETFRYVHVDKLWHVRVDKGFEAVRKFVRYETVREREISILCEYHSWTAPKCFLHVHVLFVSGLAIKNPAKKHLLVGFIIFLNAIKLACIQQVRTCKIHQAHKWSHPYHARSLIVPCTGTTFYAPEIINHLDLSSITYFTHCLFCFKNAKTNTSFK